MSQLPPILLVDESADDRELVALVLAGAFGEVVLEVAADAVALARAVAAGRFGAVVTEHELSWIRAGDLLRLIRDLRPECPVVVLTGRPIERVAAELLPLAPEALLPKSATGLVGLPRALRAALRDARRRSLAAAGEAPARRLLDALPAAVFEADGDGTLLDANPAFAALAGHADAADCVRRPLAALFADSGELDTTIAALVPGGPPRRLEAALCRADGGRLAARLTLWKPPAAGAAAGTLQALVEAAPSPRGAAGDRARAELEEIAYVVAHDLNQPLGQIGRSLELVGESAGARLDAEARELLDQARASAARLGAMVDGVLSWARVESRGGRFAPVDLGAVAARVVERLRLEPAAADARFAIAPLPTVEGDAAQLEQLLWNLFDNALKFRGAEPPKVELDADDEGALWHLRVRDNGIGLDPRQSERIFAMFQRLEPEGGRPGTGIGLAICRRVAGRHGGRIWVESRPGEGATFHVTLAKRPAAAAPAAPGD